MSAAGAGDEARPETEHRSGPALRQVLGLAARDPDQRHRASTPLELLFDLTFVVAVAQAGAALHQSLQSGQVAHGVLSYLMVFFAIWWAWMNFTWFASAYDADDVPYRLLTLLQMTGALVLAAGVASAFTGLDYRAVTLGYVIMRIGLLAQWLRAALGDPPRRAIALRYVGGVLTLQLAWVLRLALPPVAALPSFVVLVAAEIAVPVWAERAADMTPWHPEHIAERYGLFTLIVLGESIAAATAAVQGSVQAAGISAGVLAVAVAGLILVFSLWWVYFDVEVGDALRRSPEASFAWGYGHLPIFAAAAALGAGLQVAAHAVREGAAAGVAANLTAAAAVAIPVAIFLVTTGVLHARLGALSKPPATVLAEAALVLAAAGTAARVPLPISILLVAAVPVGTVVAITRLAARRAPGPAGPPSAGG